MTSRAKKGNAATNFDFLLMFVAAIRAVVADFNPEAPLPPHHTVVAELLGLEAAKAGLRDINTERNIENLDFKSGPHVWNWVTANNLGAALLASKLTEEQKNNVQRVLGGMLREFALGNLAGFASRH